MAANPVEQINYIGMLNQRCTRRNATCRFEEGPSTGPSHNRSFTCWALINEEKFPEGEGKSKQEAKQHAAKIAYEALNNRECCTPPRSVAEMVQVTPPQETASQPSDEPKSDYLSYIHTYGQRKNLKVEFPFGPPNGPAHMQEFSCKCMVGDRSFKEAIGATKKEVRALAAKYAYDELNLEDHPSEELHSGEPHSGNNVQIASDSSKSSNPDSEREVINYIGMLNTHYQSRKIILQFTKIKEEGPPHDRRFVYCATAGERNFKEAEGKKSKAAQQKAAQLALEELGVISIQQDSPNWKECLGSTSVKSKVRKDIALAPSFTLKLTDGKNVQGTESKGVMDAFEEITNLGRGGYGCVFKARHKIDRKFYAVKKVKLENEKAQKEVVTLAKLEHPNIVRYHNSWTCQDYFDSECSDSASNSSSNCKILCSALFIQMELCEKGTLKDWIDLRRTKEGMKSEALAIFQQIVEGVKYIHSENLIHRDLKPTNIFLAEGTKIKIGDFGLVANLHEERDRTKGAGTTTYMSPEQKKNVTKYGWQIDIFALGLIFFEILRIYSTESERYKDWANVRIGLFTPDFRRKFRKEALLLQEMLSEEPEKRPSAIGILESLKEKEPTSVKTC